MSKLKCTFSTHGERFIVIPTGDEFKTSQSRHELGVIRGCFGKLNSEEPCESENVVFSLLKNNTSFLGGQN